MGYEFRVNIIIINVYVKVFEMGFLKSCVCTLVAVLSLLPVMAHAESGSVESSTSSPLTVYDDHYVPDSVRAKYNLSETSAPLSLTPSVSQDKNGSRLVIDPSVPEVAPPPVVKTTANEPVVESWRARKGENLQDVLRRWGERQSVDVQWNSKNTLFVAQDFTFVGTFDGAVARLLKDNAKDTLKTHMTVDAPALVAP